MTWSNDEQNMLTGDDMGVIKYWNKEMANIARIDPAHEAGIRAISTSPVDNKFASCGDDHKVMIWDYNTQQRETTINQGNDVKTVDWHPQKGLLVCGDKNYVITLLDPRIQPKGKQSKLRTIYDHKGEVSICSWNQNGDWFLSASRDQSQKLWDLRQMAEPIRTYQGQGAAVTSLAWHPVHSDLWVSGGMVRPPFPRPRAGNSTAVVVSLPGRVAGVLAGVEGETPGELQGARGCGLGGERLAPLACRRPSSLGLCVAHTDDASPLCLQVDWHPVGHLLVTGSQDKSARFCKMWMLSRTARLQTIFLNGSSS